MRFSITFFVLAILSLIVAQNGENELEQPILTQKPNSEDVPQHPGDKIVKDDKKDKNDHPIQQQDIGTGVDRSVNNAGAATIGGMNSATNSAIDFTQIMKTLPKCYEKCLKDNTVASSFGCSGSSDIICLCSRPQLLNAVSMV